MPSLAGDLMKRVGATEVASLLNPMGAYRDIQALLRARKNLKKASAVSGTARKLLTYAQAKARSNIQANVIRGTRNRRVHKALVDNVRSYRQDINAAKAATTQSRQELLGLGTTIAKRVTVGLAAVAALAALRKKYVQLKAKANERPQYRQYDVYPEHDFAVEGATQYRQSLYNSPYGGYEGPIRSTSPEVSSTSSGMVGRGYGVYEARRETLLSPLLAVARDNDFIRVEG